MSNAHIWTMQTHISRKRTKIVIVSEQVSIIHPLANCSPQIIPNSTLSKGTVQRDTFFRLYSILSIYETGFIHYLIRKIHQEYWSTLLNFAD
jgi:hypothetical protein